MFLGGGNKLAEAEKKKNYAAELQEQIKFREEQKARDRAERLGLPPPNAAPQGGGGGGGGGQGGGGGPPPQQPMQQMGGPPPGMVMMDQGMPDMMMMQPQQMMGMPPQMMYDPMNMTMTMPMSMQQMMQQQMMQQPIMAPPIIQPPVIQPIIQPQLLQPQIQMMQPQMMGGMMGNGMMGNGMMQMPLGGLSQQLGPPMMQQQMMQQQMEQPMQSFMGGNGGGGGNGGQSPNESYGGGGGGGGGLSNFGGGDNGRRGGGKNAAQDQYRAELDRQMREREDRKKQEKREKMEEDRRFMDQQNANADQPRKGRGRVGGNDANVQSDNMGMARGYQDARQREASMGGPPGYGGGGDYGGGGGGGGGYGGPPGGGYGGPPGGGYGGPPGGGYGGPPPRQQEQWEGQQEQGWGNYGGGPRTPPGYGGAPPRNDSQVYGGPPNGGGGGGGMEFGGDGAPMNEKQAKMAKERAFQMELERQIEEKKRSKEMEKRKKDAEDQQDLAAIVKEREDAKKASDAEKGEALKSAKDLAAEAFLKAQQEAEAAKKNKFAAKRGGMVDAGDGPPYGPPAGGKSFDDKPVGAAGPAAAEEQDDDGAIGGIVIKMPKKKPPQPGPDGAQPPPVDGQQPPQGSQMGSRQESMMQGPPNGMMAPGGPGGQVMMDQMGQPMMGPPPGMYQPHLGIGGMHMGEEMMPHDPINMLAKEARSLRELVERQNADMYMLKQHAEIAEKNADLTRREMEILRVDMRRSAEPANIVIQDYTQPPGSPRRVIPARIEVLGPPIHLDHQLPPLMPGQRRPGGQQHGIASILDAVNGHGPVYTPPTPDRTHRIMSDERSLVGDSLFVYPDGSTPLNAVSRDLTPGQLSKLQRNSPARSQGSYAGSLKASREASDSGFGRIGSPGDMNINAIAARNREKQRQLANMNPSSAEALDEFLSNFGYQKGYISRGNNSLTNMPHGAGNDPRSGQSSRDLERERDKNKAPPELKHLNTLVQLAKLAFDEPSSAGAQQNKRRDSGNLGLASFSLQKQDSLDMEMRSQNGRLPRTASREMRDHSLRDHSLPNKSSWEPLPPLTADYRAQSNRLM